MEEGPIRDVKENQAAAGMGTRFQVWRVGRILNSEFLTQSNPTALDGQPASLQ